MREILINVDDLGLHPAVSRAVDELSTLGTVNSASILANGPFLSDAFKFKDRIFLGAHLNILRGKPVAARSRVSSLLNDKGRFLGSSSSLWMRYIMGRVDLEEVELEWSKQIEILLDNRIPLAHLDSEKHTHVWPRFLPIVCRLAEKYNIPRIRYPKEIKYPKKLSVATLRTCALSRWSSSFPKSCKDSRTYDFAWGVYHQKDKLNPLTFLEYMESLPEDARIEIVCHPGCPKAYDLPIDESFGNLRLEEMWEAEAERLSDPKWKELISAAGGKLRQFTT